MNARAWVTSGGLLFLLACGGTGTEPEACTVDNIPKAASGVRLDYQLHEVAQHVEGNLDTACQYASSLDEAVPMASYDDWVAFHGASFLECESPSSPIHDLFENAPPDTHFAYLSHVTNGCALYAEVVGIKEQAGVVTVLSRYHHNIKNSESPPCACAPEVATLIAFQSTTMTDLQTLAAPWNAFCDEDLPTYSDVGFGGIGRGVCGYARGRSYQ